MDDRENNALATLAGSVSEITAQDFKNRYKKILSLMEDVMEKGKDYGKVPGCGDRPMLYKSGSEKLLLLFQLAANPLVEDLSTSDNKHYRVKVEVVHTATGRVIGYGIGEASSDEEKYKWKKAVCNAEFNETDPERRRTVWKRGKNDTFYQVNQVRTNPPDIANTILKMAKKRAQTDGTLTTTGTSAMYGQDLEDLDKEIAEFIAENENQNGSETENKRNTGKPPVRPPQAKATPPDITKPTPAPETQPAAPWAPKNLKPETVSQLVDMMEEMGWSEAIKTSRLKWADGEKIGDEMALKTISQAFEAYLDKRAAEQK